MRLLLQSRFLLYSRPGFTSTSNFSQMILESHLTFFSHLPTLIYPVSSNFKCIQNPMASYHYHHITLGQATISLTWMTVIPPDWVPSPRPRPEPWRSLIATLQAVSFLRHPCQGSSENLSMASHQTSNKTPGGFIMAPSPTPSLQRFTGHSRSIGLLIKDTV